MTKVRMEDAAEAWGGELHGKGPELPLEDAKESVRRWFEKMESELQSKLTREHASPQQRSQFHDAFEALSASVTGMLQAVAIGQPQPRTRDPYGGRGAQGGEQGDRRRQEQRGGNPLGVVFDKVFGSGSDPRDYQPEPPRAAPVLLVRTETVYQQVLAACSLLDKLLSAAEPPDVKPSVPWAQTNEFLIEAQRLFAARAQGSGQDAFKLLDLLEERLKVRYSVEVISASEDTRESFKLEENDAPGDRAFRTTTPAIRVNGQVLFPGEGRGPVTNPPAGQSVEQDRGESARQHESAGDEGDGKDEGGLADG